MQQVGRDGLAAGGQSRRRLGALEIADAVEEASAPVLDRIRNLDGTVAGPDDPAVADLTAHFGVEGRLIENEKGGPGRLDEIDDLGLEGGRGLDGIADKRGRLEGLRPGGDLDHFLLLGGPAARPLSLHRGLETRCVDPQPSFGREQLGHVQGETEGVVKLEGESTRDGGDAVRPGFKVGDSAFKELEATVEGASK